MLFNSIAFAIFFIIFFYTYWSLRNRVKLQNIFVVLASYFFYGFWDWRFLGLIIFTSLSTYTTGLLISKGKNPKIWMWSNIAINLAILGFFKYFNFFATNIVELASWVGLTLDWFTLDILLPIGISFYTFQAISYSVDVYKKRITATSDIWPFLAFISFFPQLIAGPIEKATDLLPQFQKKRIFDYGNAVIGMRQILWGLAKKTLIADTCAHFGDEIYGDPAHYAGTTIILGTFLFLFQAYGDYSGYSDMAVGMGRLLGIKLSINFNFPFFSRSISEFWQRWNMTLMRWFRDYVYIPLGGSRKGTRRTCFNTLIVFLVSGLWHGADWVFVIWGLLNALLIIPAILVKYKVPKTIATLRDLPAMLLTFLIVSFLSIVFKCKTLAAAVNYLSYMSLDGGNWILPTGKSAFIYIIPMIIIEWLGRRNQFALEKLPFSKPIRWSIYWVLALLIIYGNSFQTQPYLYFQF